MELRRKTIISRLATVTFLLALTMLLLGSQKAYADVITLPTGTQATEENDSDSKLSKDQTTDQDSGQANDSSGQSSTIAIPVKYLITIGGCVALAIVFTILILTRTGKKTGELEETV